jgi:hypothetical protein
MRLGWLVSTAVDCSWFAAEPERADRSGLALVDELLQQQLVGRLEA